MRMAFSLTIPGWASNLYILAGHGQALGDAIVPAVEPHFTRQLVKKYPHKLSPSSSESSQRYLAWRADVVTGTMDSLAQYARSLQPDILISANDYDTIMHPTYISHGIDLPGLASCQDVVMIEDFALPRYS